MISRLHVENFKCLANVDVEFAPLTILIGPNDCGKTSLLEAIELLGDTTEKQWVSAANDRGGLETLVWMKDATRDVKWQVEGKTSGGLEFQYCLCLSPGHQLPHAEKLSVNDRTVFEWNRDSQQQGQIQINVPHGPQTALAAHGNHTTLFAGARQQKISLLAQVANAIGSTVKYRLQPDRLRTSASIGTNPVLSPSGDNLVSVLDSIMSHPNRKLILGLEEILHREVPTVSSISLVPAQKGGNQKALQYALATDPKTEQHGPATLESMPPVVIPATLASDGLLLLTAFIAMAYTSSPDIIFIEEPENGIHYSRLKLVIDVLRKLTTGEIGIRPRQVIITSHSPVLLNLARPEEIRVFNRTIKDGAQIKSLALVKNAERMLKEFAPGELWYLLGEQALVKGEQP